MGIFSDWFKNAATRAATSDAHRLLSVVESYGLMERTQLRAATNTAFAFIVEDCRSHSISTFERAVPLLYDEGSYDNQLAGEISKLNLRLIGVQKQLHKSPDEVSQLIASGIPIWLLSLRAAINIELLPHARRAWNLIDQVDHDYLQDFLDRVSLSLEPKPLAVAVSRASRLPIPSSFIPK